MRLDGLHVLQSSDAKLLPQLLSEEESEEPKSEPEKKGKEEIGNLKYTKSPLRKAIEGADMTSQELADQAGVDPSTVSRNLHPQDKDKGRRPSYDQLKKYAQVLGKSVTKLFPDLA